MSVEAVLSAAPVARVGADNLWRAQLSCRAAVIKNCETVGCEKNAWYNFSGWPARFCRQHREEGMVRTGRPPRLLLLGTLRAQSWLVQRQVFIGQKICEAQGCTTIAVFGMADQEERFCKAHKLEYMVRTLAQRHRY